MYENLKSGLDENGVSFSEVGDFGTKNFWSSSESGPSEAWFVNFGTGSDANSNVKTNASSYYVRCIRTFQGEIY